jgi:hypothetical protein
MKLNRLSLSEFLALENEGLDQLRTEQPLGLEAEVQDSGLRLVTMIAPKNYCWGMEFAFSRFYKSREQEVAATASGEAVANEISRLRVRPTQIALGLIPLPNECGFAYGNEEKALWHWWFRSYALPNQDKEVGEFTALWVRHQQELDQFFLFRYPDQRVREEGSAGRCFVPWKQARILDRLFCTKTGPLGVDAATLISYLERHANNVDELKTSLTPEFLLQECVRWDSSLLSHRGGFQAETMAAVTDHLGDEFSAVSDARTSIALHRIKIARKLGWPLGVRQLRDMLQAVDSETCSASELCVETSAYIDAAISRFPVLVS